MRNQNDSNNEDSDIAQANITTGMALPDGAMVEQLSGRNLLLYAKGEERIGATIEYGDRNYRPVPFDNQLEDALHLPQATAEYECVGSLLKKIAKAIECHARLDAPANVLVAGFMWAFWVPEFLPMTPVLNVCGAPGTETVLWAMLTHLCRRRSGLSIRRCGSCGNYPQDWRLQFSCPTLVTRLFTDSSMSSATKICSAAATYRGFAAPQWCLRPGRSLCRLSV